MLGGGPDPPSTFTTCWGGVMAEDPPQRLVVRPSGPLILHLISQPFSKKIILCSYMSLETGQILQDIGLSATTSQLWGQNRLFGTGRYFLLGAALMTG